MIMIVNKPLGIAIAHSRSIGRQGRPLLTRQNALNCRAWCTFREPCGGGLQSQCRVMTNFTELAPVPSDRPAPFTDQLRVAVAAYLARYKGSSREHTESDLRCYPHLVRTRMDRHAATRRPRRLSEAAGVRITKPDPHMLRHTFVTTMLDAGADLRDVQIAARHADPRTTMRYGRARKHLDRHPNYILAAYMASGT